jgi:hypothetical protein
LYLVAGATSNFVYAGVAGVDMLIVVMHVVMPAAVHFTAKRNNAIAKPKKAKRPTAWPKIVVGIVKPIPLQKTWMMLLQETPLIGLRWHRVGKIWWFFALICKAAVIFAIEWVKL